MSSVRFRNQSVRPVGLFLASQVMNQRERALGVVKSGDTMGSYVENFISFVLPQIYSIDSPRWLVLRNCLEHSLDK